MTTIAPTLSDRRITTTKQSHPLLSVLGWELRRFRTSRLFWLQALGFFCLLLLVFALSHNDIGTTIGNGGPNLTFDGSVAITSPWGLLHQLPNGPLLLLCMTLPFVNADGVTRDLTRRTHELLMTTVLPDWAYVWGRYLIGLLMSLGLALVLLAALLGLGLLRHLTDTAYPALEIGPVLLLWVGMVIPAMVLVSSLSFALGTIFPRQSTLIKIVILLGWFFGAVILPAATILQPAVATPSGQSLQASAPAWYIAWDPTSVASAFGTFPQYDTVWEHQTSTATSLAQVQHIFISLENMVPNVSAWFVPHLILAVLSLLLVALAAFSFQRFRQVFGA